MKIGIIGVGIVGGAIKYGFEKLGHKVKVHDIKYNTKIEDIIDTDICYICVPTPQSNIGKCDTSIVEDTVNKLITLKYRGIIAIKSTVEPGTTDKLQENNPTAAICFVPEFLRERCATIDFTENHDILIVGTNKQEIYNKIVECHGRYPHKTLMLKPKEAELVKYFNNAYNATLITFANSFYEICNALGVDYNNIKNAAVLRTHIFDRYLDCNESFRGFGGMCLPKDVSALNYIAKQLKTPVEFFNNLLKENSKYKTTVYEGMRNGNDSNNG